MTLFPDYTTFLIVGILLCLAPILKRLLFEPLATIIERREEMRAAAETGFEAARTENEQAVQLGEEAVANARRSGYREMETMRREAAGRAGEKLEAARRQAAETLADGQKRLDQQVREAETALEGTVVGLGDQLMARLLGRAG